MNPNDLVALEKMLMRQEGLRFRLYRDTQGKATIGYGRNLDAVGISGDEAHLMLSNDTRKALNDVATRLHWSSKLNAPRLSALISWVFNEGIVGVLAWKPTLAAVEAEQWQVVHDHLLNSLAATQAPERYKELAEIFLTGEL